MLIIMAYVTISNNFSFVKHCNTGFQKSRFSFVPRVVFFVCNLIFWYRKVLVHCPPLVMASFSTFPKNLLKLSFYNTRKLVGKTCILHDAFLRAFGYKKVLGSIFFFFFFFFFFFSFEEFFIE